MQTRTCSEDVAPNQALGGTVKGPGKLSFDRRCLSGVYGSSSDRRGGWEKIGPVALDGDSRSEAVWGRVWLS